MSEKKLGVIGGMGPLATVRFFERIINHTEAYKDQEHIDILISNHATLPDRTGVIKNKDYSLFLDEIKKDMDIMNFSKVDNIAIPCNTSHYFYEEMQAMTDIPIINMIDETCRYIAKNRKSKKIVVLGTSGTIDTGVYPKYAKKHGLESVKLDRKFMDISMETIYNVKNNMVLKSEKFDEILNFYKDNDVNVILACTELSCLNIPENLRENTVDAMDILVKKSIEYSDKIYKK